MSFSIITVNLDNAAGLKKTISNISLIRGETNSPVELIIIDGASTDESINIINDNSKVIDKWISEKDKGIFDGMNKGMGLAVNDWLVFMNSGDVFYNYQILEMFMAKKIDQSINFVYGDAFQGGKIRCAQSIEMLKVGVMHACHQSMFFRRSLNIQYGKNSKLYGDYGFVADYVFRNPDGVLYFNEIISETEPGGVGSKASFRKRYEKYQQVIVRYGLISFVLSLLYRISLLFKIAK